MRCDAIHVEIGYVVPLQYKNNIFWIFKTAISKNCEKWMATCGMSEDDNFFNSLFPREEKSREELFLNYFATYLEDKVDIEQVKKNFETLEKSDFLDYYTKQIDPVTQCKYTGYHINWFDYEKLKKMLEEAGFEDVCRSASQRSKFNEMRGKEFDTRPSWSLHVEAIK